ncbi:MAG: shikimate dehydrogenase family protein [Fusobacteriaceae bacterium]
MKKYGLLGKGINYSLSPKLHEIIFNSFSIKGEYILLDKNSSEQSEEEYIQEILKKIRKKEIKGINVTIPYKEKIMKYLDKIEKNAKIIGAVNTIFLKNGKLEGHNTDYYGITETFKKMKLDLKGKNIYILGTGGASKAAVKVILDLGGIPKLISRQRKTLKICNENFITENYEELNIIKKEYLLIDTTPVPLKEEIENKFENIFQMKYYLDETKKNEKNYQDGLYMLVIQGIKSEELWQEKKIKNIDWVYRELLESVKK